MTEKHAGKDSAPLIASDAEHTDAGHEKLSGFRANEVFVAIVGPAGAGVGTAAKALDGYFRDNEYQPTIIKASELIRRTAETIDLTLPHPPSDRKSLERVGWMQDRGDEIRKGEAYGKPEDHSAIARLVLQEIRLKRAELQDEVDSEKEVVPNGSKKAYIIDSLRHPFEAAFLREVYQDAFTLLGVVCDTGEREKRIRHNLFDRREWDNQETKEQVQAFLNRDERSPEKFGQQVSETFHQADFYVDNSKDAGDNLNKTGMNKQLRRFVHLITHKSIVRPTISETAMHHARSAQLRSACLSRQVGAALVDKLGNIVATGTNDVPRAGGGLYGEEFKLEQDKDERCAYRGSPVCRNNEEQNKIIDELLDALTEIIPEYESPARDQERVSIIQRLRKTRLGGLIEFSRAVHAEMDAILSASTAGVSSKHCRMYATTFPCHYCARHLVAAGVEEVQFIEPYPKSMATDLHDDSITTDSSAWKPLSDGGDKVLFHPFVGIAPRLYSKVFLKDRDYKDDTTGQYRLGQPVWGRPIDIYTKSYIEMESKLALG